MPRRLTTDELLRAGQHRLKLLEQQREKEPSQRRSEEQITTLATQRARAGQLGPEGDLLED